MLDLYSWSTPNGFKASIMLEEIDLPYNLIAVNIGKGEQHDPEFRQISPNGKIPALVDRPEDGGTVRRIFESGNILLYLAEKSGQLLPQEGIPRTECLGWLFFQMGHLGPMIGQWHWFKNAAPVKDELGVKRYREESLRLLEVLNGRLGETPYLAGDEYSIADIACYPWVHAAIGELRQEDPEAVSALKPLSEWLDRVGQRPAVQQGMNVPDTEAKEATEGRAGMEGPASGGTVRP